MSAAETDRYADYLRAMQETERWRKLRDLNGWQDLYLDREAFTRFLAVQEEQIRTQMIELGFYREPTP